SGAASPSKSEEWGQGFLLNFQSGYTAGPVGFGLDALGQVGISLDSGGRTTKADRDSNPGALFPLEDDGSEVSNFSRIDFTGKAGIGQAALRLGALQPKLPRLPSDDVRLLPQTCRAGQLTSRDIQGLTLNLGQIERACGRASADYQVLTIAGGTERVNQSRFA